MKHLISLVGLGLLLGLFLTVIPALAQTGTDYELSWWTATGGGGNSQNGAYSLTSAIGQPATETLSGGEYDLVVGIMSILLKRSA